MCMNQTVRNIDDLFQEVGAPLSSNTIEDRTQASAAAGSRRNPAQTNWIYPD